MEALAREYVRRLGDDRTADRFDDALEQYGVERALEEAAVGIGIGFLINRARRQQQPAHNPDHVQPLLEQQPVGEERAIITVSTAHEELKVDYEGTVVYLWTPAGRLEHDVGFEVDDLEWLTDRESAVSEIMVSSGPIEVENLEEAGYDP